MTPGPLLRPRLTPLFEQGLQRSLTRVSAPAGYGKTTSVVLWLRSLTVSSIKRGWYALDAEDNEFSIFFTRFVSALDKAVPGALPTVTTGFVLGYAWADSYANMLAEACLQLPHEVVLVVDDYHHVAVPDVHTV